MRSFLCLLASGVAVSGFVTIPFTSQPLLRKLPLQSFSTASSSSFSSLGTKDELEAAISGGVGKGYGLRNKDAKKEIEQLIADLEADCTDVSFPRDFEHLDGRWKLLYSSNIVLGTLKVSPLKIGEVYQVVDSSMNSVKNVVYGTLSPPLFEETWGNFPLDAIADAAKGLNDMASFKVDFALDHTFEISSEESPAELKISISNLKILNSERRDARSLSLPVLRALSKSVFSGKFQTTYLDSDFRISRGSYGEIRAFKRVEEEW